MEKQTRTLTIDSKELYFSAAHYLPDYDGLCAYLHGHTYFVRNLVVTVEGFVDLTDIKKAIKSMDHMLIIPECDQEAWHGLFNMINSTPGLEKLRKVFSRHKMIVDTDVPGTTVERMAEELQSDLMSIPGVKNATFELYEGPIAGRVI